MIIIIDDDIIIMMMMMTILSKKEYPVAIFPVSKIFCSGSSSLSKAIFPPWTLHHKSWGKGPDWASPPALCDCGSHVYLNTGLVTLSIILSQDKIIFLPLRKAYSFCYMWLFT